jgi:hypothetical protein
MIRFISLGWLSGDAIADVVRERIHHAAVYAARLRAKRTRDIGLDMK